jgi:predicted Zn-dependent protease
MKFSQTVISIFISCSLFFIAPVFFETPAYCYSEYNLATGREETLFISIEKEVEMGRSISEQVENKFELDKNHLNQEKVARIGKKIADVSDRRELIYRFRVLDKDDVENAFALPGGYVYIFKALFEKLDDDEIAAILAHEVGHICARHGIKRLQSGLGYQILQILVAGGARDSYTRRKAGEAFGQLMLANSREHEFEADVLAVRYLERAGYDPAAMVKVLDKLITWQMEGKTGPKRYWYTHPYLSARRAKVNKEITGQMSFSDYMNLTEEESYIIPY